jgi:hypothetical protein
MTRGSHVPHDSSRNIFMSEESVINDMQITSSTT